MATAITALKMSELSEIQAYHLRVPLDRPLRLGEMLIENREYVFVRLIDDEGNCGTALGHSRNAPIASVIERCVKPYWLQRNLEAYEAVYAQTVKANVCLGTNGIFWRALSLVDCAFFDLLARRSGKSLCAFLGGKPGPLRKLIVGGYPLEDETPLSLAREMEMVRARNPSGVKIASCGDLRKDTQRLKTCREVIPMEIPLMIDCYWSCDDVDNVLEHTRSWEALNIGWIEDPLSFDDYAGIGRLVREGKIPVAFGDEQTGLRAFTRLMDEGIPIVRLDATVCGGVKAFLSVAQMAAERGLTVACHVFPCLHAQLAGVVPSVQWIETMLPESEIEAVHKLQHETGLWGEVDDGSGSASPGVDYAWDEDRLREYAMPLNQ